MSKHLPEPESCDEKALGDHLDAQRISRARGEPRANPTEQDGLRLVAFVAARSLQRPSERALRRELADGLPNFMIPSEFVFLEQLPKTSMGKINREQLRSLAAGSRPHAPAGELPQNVVERDIAAIWAQVLNVDHVAAGDDFFELGGDSLKVMQVCARIQERFEIDLPLSTLFRRRTVVDLVPYVLETVREA